MRIYNVLLLLLLTVIPTGSLFAHHGHGSDSGNSLAHYVTSPGHAHGILGILIFAAVATVVWHRSKDAAR